MCNSRMESNNYRRNDHRDEMRYSRYRKKRDTTIVQKYVRKNSTTAGIKKSPLEEIGAVRFLFNWKFFQRVRSGNINTFSSLQSFSASSIAFFEKWKWWVLDKQSNEWYFSFRNHSNNYFTMKINSQKFSSVC